jgi:flagellin
MISIQTNVDSLVAQQNLNLDNEFQSNTIQQLTSGYRINKSGDDAAGLAVANGIQSEISQLTQGVNNANNGVSQLQIVDGGLSNISTILNRLQTLATESASSTFTGNRATLNQEYSGLLSEITRQASNINMAAGGTFNNLLSVFVGGGSNASNSTVSIDLSGSQNAVDATSLGLVNTNVLGGGTGFTNNSQSLTGGVFLNGATASESFAFNTVVNGIGSTKVVTVSGGTGGISGSDVLAQLNNQLSADQLGITAGLDGNGALEFSGTTPFNVTDLGSGTTVATEATPALISAGATISSSNTATYLDKGATGFTVPASASNGETLTFQTGGQSFDVNLTSSNAANVTAALSTINAAASQYGISAVLNSAGTGIDFQSSSSFTVKDAFTTTGGATVATAGVFGAAGTTSATAPTSSPTANADAAVTAINNAIQQLGLTQGIVGAGENTLNYAINLAQSQISNFSSAESSIKDANVAMQAANLSKSQVLTQTAVAALAQANSEPQAVLKLLQG